METSNVENSIAEKIFGIVKQNTDVTDSDIEKLLDGEIQNVECLKESWQIHYAKERIKKIIFEKQVAQSCGEQQVSFGSPGWNFLFVVVFSSIMRKFLAGSLVYTIVIPLFDVLSIYYLFVWVVKLFYKNKREKKNFLLVKRIFLMVAILLCVYLFFTSAIVFMGTKN